MFERKVTVDWSLRQAASLTELQRAKNAFKQPGKGESILKYDTQSVANQTERRRDYGTGRLYRRSYDAVVIIFCGGVSCGGAGLHRRFICIGTPFVCIRTAIVGSFSASIRAGLKHKASTKYRANTHSRKYRFFHNSLSAIESDSEARARAMSLRRYRAPRRNRIVHAR